MNIDDRIRKNIRRKITSGTATIDLFDDAKNAVFILIKRDSYKRFKQQYSTSASLETLKARWCFVLLGKSKILRLIPKVEGYSNLRCSVACDICRPHVIHSCSITVHIFIHFFDHKCRLDYIIIDRHGYGLAFVCWRLRAYL